MYSSGLENTAAVNFFIRNVQKQFSCLRMYHVPRVGDVCVFNSDTRYKVFSVEWCLGDDATSVGVRVNVELEEILVSDTRD
jgi:formyltetrahydrofolate synthetase